MLSATRPLPLFLWQGQLKGSHSLNLTELKQVSRQIVDAALNSALHPAHLREQAVKCLDVTLDGHIIKKG
jgi:hypothetical protein